jgi:hypothetical protein
LIKINVVCSAELSPPKESIDGESTLHSKCNHRLCTAFANSGLMSTSLLVLAPFIICVTAAGRSRLAVLEKAASSRIRNALNVIGSIERDTSTALTVALRTSHRSMPNRVIKGRDTQNIIAYILSLKGK